MDVSYILNDYGTGQRDVGENAPEVRTVNFKVL